MSALDELLKDIPQDYDEVDVANHLLHWREPAAAELAALKARVKQAEENWHKNEARVAKLQESKMQLEARNREWLESYDITMPCGHKNRYLLTNGRGELVKDYRGDCVCVLCQLEKADEIEAALKVAE